MEAEPEEEKQNIERKEEGEHMAIVKLIKDQMKEHYIHMYKYMRNEYTIHGG